MVVTEMKIEKVDDNKIKITISIDDLIERNIDFDSLAYDSPEAQELFWDMMDQAEEELGFNANDAQLCIEAIPDDDDTFIVTITKIIEDNEFESLQKFIKNRYKRNELRTRKKSRNIYSSILMYSFSKLEDLKSLTHSIDSKYCGESSLYKYKNTYYLVLSRNQFHDIENVKTFELFISEFGKKIINTSFYEGVLNEHGKLLVDRNAINIISNYF